MTENTSPGAKIQAARKARDWSQEDLARELGTTKATVSRWESDKSAISGGWIGEVSRVLGIPPTELAARRAKLGPADRAARSSHAASARPTLVLPEESMSKGRPDPQLIEVWQRVVAVYLARKKNPKKWTALTSNLDSWMEPPVKARPVMIREADGTTREA